MRFSQFKFAILGGAACVGALVSSAQAATIYYSARYYSPIDSDRTSHAHLYAIEEKGGQARQLTFGPRDEWSPRLAADNRTLAFQRVDADFNAEICALDVSTRRVQTLLTATKDASIAAMEWSPNGQILAVQRDSASGSGNSALYLMDLSSKRQRRFVGVKSWAWRPQTSQIRLSDARGSRLLDAKSGREMPLSNALADTIWLNRDRAARLAMKAGSESSPDWLRVKSVEIFNLGGQKVRAFAPQNVSGIFKNGRINEDMDGEPVEFDVRASLKTLGGQSDNVMLVADESTSSGASYAFTRFDTRSGATRFLARGRVLSWHRDAKRFAVVDSLDTRPYDTLPNGHKRVVYTTRLLVGDGIKPPRPLVSGLVLVRDCVWGR